MSTKTYCDGCGVQLLNNAAAPAFNAQAQIKVFGVSGATLFSTPMYDLCQKCKDRFQAGIDVKRWFKLP